jgi:23S rRNA pseudouridine1911/1915/1917 synthase
MNILHEDEALLFIDKPPDLVVQRGYDAEEAVLFEQVQEYLRPRGESAFLLQRLDRGTSGVIFFSKLAEANSRLTRQFEKKSIRKSYLALCTGGLSVAQTVDAPLARIGPISFGVRAVGKRAVTVLRPLEAGSRASLLEIDLLTGRTHQIRAHLAAIHHPLVGDWLYGTRDASRPMLHAASISLIHPSKGTPLTVEAPLPRDFIDEMASRGLKSRTPLTPEGGS